MAVQSIRTTVQIRDVAGNHLFVSTGKMPLRKVNRVSQIDHATQQVRSSSEAFDDAGNLLPSRPGSPKVISRSCFSGGFSIFNDLDFGGWFCG